MIADLNGASPNTLPYGHVKVPIAGFVHGLPPAIGRGARIRTVEHSIPILFSPEIYHTLTSCMEMIFHNQIFIRRIQTTH